MDQEVRRLFHELAALPADRRQQVLSQRGVTPEIRAEVESLLHWDLPGGPCFTSCVAETADDALRSSPAAAERYCGPYRLVRLLGRGGMGAVYLGERSDGEIQQKVAVKLLVAGDRPGWRERFLAERQVLASIHHPSIVHAIDAGHTDDGQPFLAMEYVEGVPIDEYAAPLRVRERLSLFVRVCEAVAYAHARLIIHRDLKPSNILVNGSGDPKLLDFGIAKLLDAAGDATWTAERLLTPGYASPEQVQGAAQTTATDIYSMGAVLYRLVTGQVAAAEEPVPPSRLNPDVPGDVDYIVRKALRVEPDERYASMEAFANDVRAVLDSKPVAARSGDAWYRTRRFLRRHWMPATAAALVVASLAAGLYVANRERVVAQKRFGQLQHLSSRVFELDKAIRNLPGSMRARQDLVAASLEYLEGLARDAQGDLDLAREIGEGYWRIARVQGVPAEVNLGDRAAAEASLAKAGQFLDSVLARRPYDRRALLRSATIAQDRMILAQEEHRNTEAVAYAGKGTNRADAFVAQGGIADTELTEISAIYANIALCYVNLHRYAEAIPLARRSVELARSAPSGKRRVGPGLSLLANALRYQGDLEQAYQVIGEARKLAEDTVYPNETLRMIELYGVLLRQGMIMGEEDGVNLGRRADAIESLQKAFDLAEGAAQNNPGDSTSRGRTAASGRELGRVLNHVDPGRALAVYDLALRRLSEIPSGRKVLRDQANLLAGSSYALRFLGRPGEAKQRIDRALAILRGTGDYPAAQTSPGGEVYVVLCALADYDSAPGEPRPAIGVLEELLRMLAAAGADPLNDLRDAPPMSGIYERLAGLYRRAGDPAKAAAMEARRSELWSNWDRKLPNNAFVRAKL